MPFIPHTAADIEAMLKAIGVPSMEQLFDEIPAALRWTSTVAEVTGTPARTFGDWATANSERFRQ